MEDQTSHPVALKGDGNQNPPFARSFSTRPPITPGEFKMPTQPLLPGGGGGDPPENEIDILISEPSANATVPVLLSQGTFSVRGGVAVVGSAKFTSVEVQFGGFSKSASGKSSWTCTSPTITTSGPLTITARALNGSIVVAAHITNVTIVVTDDIGPVVTITQPAVDGLPAAETNGVFTVALQGTATDTMSGVQKVQFSVDGANFTNIVAPTAPFPPTLNWQTTVTVPVNPTSPQARTIFIRAIDGKNNVTQTSRTVVTDNIAPTLTITEPPQALVNLPSNSAGGATLFRLAGAAVDDQSGVKSVGWALDPPATNPQFKPAVVTSGGGKQVQWSVENIAIPGPAGTPHILTVRCADVAGKFTDKSLSVAVAPQYPQRTRQSKSISAA